MSQLKVDSIVPSGGVVSGANGGIIQVVQVTKTDQFATSNTAIQMSQECLQLLHQDQVQIRSLFEYV